MSPDPDDSRRAARILFVEDDVNAREGVAEILSAAGYETTAAAGVGAARAALRGGGFDLLVTDVRLPDGDGLDLALEAKRTAPETPVVLVTAFGTIRAAVEAMQRGVDSYLTKPLDFDELRLTVARALERRRLREENRRLRAEIGARYGFRHLLGSSVAWRRAVAEAERAAPSDSPVLLLGESGTGKEMVAHALHRASPRADGPFVAMNCAAIPHDLLENELFGHEAGAFTGATRRQAGKVEAADGGTLFLDEVGDMPHTLQAKILRVLEDGAFTRLGGTARVASDFRVVASTNRDLGGMIRGGAFREDLYFRLAVLVVRLPPLRDREGDVETLLDAFLDRLSAERGGTRPAIAPASAAVLRAHAWPGNVRELESVAERLFLSAGGAEVGADLVRDSLAGVEAAPRFSAGAETSGRLPDAVRALEEEMIRETLSRCGGNRTRAAAELGISLRSLQYRMREMGIR